MNRANRFFGQLFVVVSLVAFTANAKVNLIWNFDQGTRTTTGGSYNALQKAPSTTTTRIVSDTRRGDGGSSMRIDYANRDTYCGVWFHLFDSDVEDKKRTFVDVTKTPYLSFWIKSDLGGEQVDVRMADPRYALKEDTRSAGSVRAYLREGVTTNWQEVVVPFADFRLTDPRAAVFTLLFEGSGTVYLDDLSFKTSADDPVPESQASVDESATETEVPRALWVWETEPLLFDEIKRDELFSFCEQHGLTDLYTQFGTTCDADDKEPEACQLKYPASWRQLIRVAGKNGVRIHALDGRPDFCLKAWHPHVLALAKAILDFNEQNPDTPFYGLRFDNEPYLLMGFHGRARMSILQDLLELNTRLMALVQRHNASLRVGADIPFWFDEISAEEGGEVDYADKTQPAAYHLIDILDDVTLMDYRDSADGRDGIIEHGLGEVQYAGAVGKHVHIGVETFKYDPAHATYVSKVPRSAFEAYAMQDGELTQHYRKSPTLRIRSLFGPNHVFVGLQHAIEDQALPTSVLENELLSLRRDLASEFGPTTHLAASDKQELVQLLQSGEDIRDQVLHDPSDEIFVLQTDAIMLDKVTFAEESKQELEEALQGAHRIFRNEPGFGGFAIHHYKSYQQLADKPSLLDDRLGTPVADLLISDFDSPGRAFTPFVDTEELPDSQTVFTTQRLTEQENSFLRVNYDVLHYAGLAFPVNDLDLRDFGQLTVRMRGHTDRPIQIKVQLRDADDKRFAVDMTEFFSDVASNWTEVVVPLTKLHSAVQGHTKPMVELAFVLFDGKGEWDIDDIHLKAGP